jgi:hypothetical protein
MVGRVRLLRKVVELGIFTARESESHEVWEHGKMAERVRFELTCRNYPTIRFRVGAVMTASVPLRARPQPFLQIRAALQGARILAEQ